MKLKAPFGVKTPRKTVSVLLILIWILSLITFLIAFSTYVLQLYQAHMIQAAPTNPITRVIIVSAVPTFAIITYATRKNGLKHALGSTLARTAATLMIFELPFDLSSWAERIPA